MKYVGLFGAGHGGAGVKGSADNVEIMDGVF